MKKIIHFSDLHLGHTDMCNRFEQVVLNLVKIKQPAEDYVIVITGDIVEKASLENYSMAKQCLALLTKRGHEVLVVHGEYANLSELSLLNALLGLLARR